MKSRNTQGGGGFRKIPSNSRKNEHVPQSSWDLMASEDQRPWEQERRMSVWTQVSRQVRQREAGAELSGREARHRSAAQTWEGLGSWVKTSGAVGA